MNKNKNVFTNRDEKFSESRKRIDLSTLKWELSGHTPTAWSLDHGTGLDVKYIPEILPVPVTLPSSVQGALRKAGILPDYYKGLNSRACEWVEHRDWVYSAQLPAGLPPASATVKLHCLGLDGFGFIFLNGRKIGEFRNAFIPHEFDLTDAVIAEKPNHLEIVFSDLPRFLGVPNRTSEVRQWKPRFNYQWDWMPRNVQIGVWDEVFLELLSGPHITAVHPQTDFDAQDATGVLKIKGLIEGQADRVCIELRNQEKLIRSEEVPISTFENGLCWSELPIKPWQPNTAGASSKPALYRLICILLDESGRQVDVIDRRIGFKHIDWQPCRGAPAQADPWLCVVNGNPTFLQGVNWTPIRPYFADVKEKEYRKRIALYKELGFNLLRVWGGSFLEKEVFYDLCDEYGLLVWQDFPLSSSGPDNEPPYDEAFTAEIKTIALSWVTRRRHHVCLLMWCGGNELQTKPDGSPGIGSPLTLSHPLLAELAEICSQADPGRRFIPTSPCGPVFTAELNNFGKGIHWEVHGPWSTPGDDRETVDYWNKDDALFRSEVGVAGAATASLIEQYAGRLNPLPVSKDNPLWRRFDWWVENERFAEIQGRRPQTLSEYVTWSQQRQAWGLCTALKACKKRFPGIGGMIIWMGHDAFPCPTNTSILDFTGQPKPSALALKKILQSETLMV